MTGGTICMEKSPDGLIPARNFLERCMAGRREFDDGTKENDMEVMLWDRRLCRVEECERPSDTGKFLWEAYYVRNHLPVRSHLLIANTRYTVLEFEELLDSSSIDSQGWAEIARTISRNYTLFDGFVVLHGTDSLAYTGSALSFMLQNLGKPVILTGRSRLCLLKG